jgi:hypothetical protein
MKILYKILEKWIQQHIERISHVALLLTCRDHSTYINLEVWGPTLREWREKIHGHFVRCVKSIWQNLTSFHDLKKNSLLKLFQEWGGEG